MPVDFFLALPTSSHEMVHKHIAAHPDTVVPPSNHPAHFARIRYQKSTNVLMSDRLFCLHLKESKYDPLSSCLVDFKERANIASVKNFQVAKSPPLDPNKLAMYHSHKYPGFGDPINEEARQPVLLQMGKVGKNCFNMDFQYPLSLLQAFGICLSRFDTNL